MNEIKKREVRDMIDKLEASGVHVGKYLVLLNDSGVIEVHTGNEKSYQSRSVVSVYYWIKNDDTCRRSGLKSS